MEANTKELERLAAFLKKPSHSQILLPFCSSENGDDVEQQPVALLSGNINLRRSFRKDGVLLPFEAELELLERKLVEIQENENQTSTYMGIGEVIDLSSELERIKIDTATVDALNEKEKEVEIKEEWSEDITKKYYSSEHRTERRVNVDMNVNHVIQQSKVAIPADIAELLRLAEEEDEQFGKESVVESKIEILKKEVVASKGKRINLPKIHSNGLIGDIIERDSKPSSTITMTTNSLGDSVSSRIILNELRGNDLKVSSTSEETASTSNKPLKRSSLFKTNLNK